MESLALQPSKLDYEWSYSINNAWNGMSKSSRIKSNSFKENIKSYFGLSSNVFDTALYLICKSTDFYKRNVHGLSLTICQVFNEWLEDRRSDENVSIWPAINIQKRVLHFSCQQPNSGVTKIMLSTFMLNDKPELFTSQIEDLFSVKKYKEACICATALKLQDRFSIHDFSIPLILQDKVQLVEGYVADDKELQMKLLEYLDGMLGNPSAIDDCFAKCINVPNIRRETISGSRLKKLISRLIKLFKLEPSICPNFHAKQSQGALWYLLNSLKLDGPNWEDFIPETIGNNVDLQKQLISSLVSSNDVSAAKRWFEHYKLCDDDFSPTVINVINGLQTLEISNYETADWDEEEKPKVKEFYSLKIPRERVIIVDNIFNFEKCMYFLTEQRVVGIDAEWKPSFGMQKQKISIMQLAVSDRVYILDFVKLLDTIKHEDWLSFMYNVFFNPNLIKIGFGFQTDVQMIASTLPEIAPELSKIANLVNIENLIERLIDLDVLSQDLLSASGKCSNLSNVVGLLFGRPLSKIEQFSDWEKRPLRETQIIYASADAYCLVEVFEFLAEKCEERNIDFGRVLYEIERGNSNKKKKYKGKSKTKAKFMM